MKIRIIFSFLVIMLTSSCATTYKPVIFNHDPFVDKVMACYEDVRENYKGITKTSAWLTCDRTERDKQGLINGILTGLLFGGVTIGVSVMSALIMGTLAPKNNKVDVSCQKDMVKDLIYCNK